MIVPLSSISLHFEYDLVAARRRARQVAALLGFEEQDQTRIATVTSEIARNALRYAGGGRVEFGVDSDADSQYLTLNISDRGPGISNLEDVLAGRYESDTGMGLGILGARRLMDDVQISTSPEKGTLLAMKKRLPSSAAKVTKERVAKIVDELARQRPESPLEEIQQQNRDLMIALAELERREEELTRLNQELEDTNRGVLALYAELDDKADRVRHADEMKTRFLANMSHEFRTPVNAILALTRLLAEEELPSEGRKQVSLISRAAGDLESLVNDLLDLAKIEAGKVDVRAAPFEVTNLFSALRGMLRPLLLNRALSLVFEDPEGVPDMVTDEGKVSQILRNFISNALKFTEAGEVRVTASVLPERNVVRFCVADTGIGIAAEDQERVFDEYSQIDNPLQARQKGTGLGLPLTRRLATLLGGTVGVRSAPGVGSSFWADIPILYREAGEESAGRGGATAPESSRTTTPAPIATSAMRVLVIDDDETMRYTITSFAYRPQTLVLEADNGVAGIALAQNEHPDVILLDLMMPGIGGHEVLQRLKSDPATAPIPVIVVTSRFVNDEEREQILGRAASVINKGDLGRETVTRAIDDAIASGRRPST